MRFYTGILTANSDHILGLDKMTFPVTPRTQPNTNDVPHESQDDVVEVQAAEVAARRSAGRARHI